MNHRGFTVIEILVSVAVVGVLLALLIPAIHSGRESSRRMDCQNRLRQIGVATNAFDASFRSLPSNGWGYRWIGDPTRGVGSSQPGGWVFQIAPFAEFPIENVAGDEVQQHLFRSELSTRPFSLMRCPSRPGDSRLPASQAAAPLNASYRRLVPKTDFAGNEGDYITNTDGGPPSLLEGDQASYRWTETKEASGVLFLRSKIRFSQIADGTSNVYLVGEKAVNSSHYWDNLDLGYDQSLFSGVDLDMNRWTIDPPIVDSKRTVQRQFGSAHPASYNMLFCDGSIRSIEYSIQRDIHRSLGNRMDGNR